MENINNILEKQPKYIFWDLDISNLDPQMDSDIIISRILMFSNTLNYNDNILFLENIYSLDLIKKTITTTKERISDEVCSLTAKRYKLTIKSKFNKHVCFN